MKNVLVGAMMDIILGTRKIIGFVRTERGKKSENEMAGRKQQGIPINSERFRIALSSRGFSLLSFGELLKHHNIIQLRTLQYRLKNEHMNPLVLDELCRLIDVSPDFVMGEGVYKKDYVPSYNEPIIEAMRLICCKDCIHNVANRKTDPMDITDYSGQDIVCDYFMTDGQCPDDFCSHAERKRQ